MMKLAYRVFIVSLFCFSLAAAALAQTAVSTDKSKRSAKDDRNTAPTFGTGGAMGGPTGLFTVYDAQTLRRGEYTFSAAYSNFDRDPGDVDITEVPLSFQIGVTNNFELFFNTDGYRAVKVNSPANLSSFYLPNSQLNIGGSLTSGGAIILGPNGPFGGPLSLAPVFRPQGTQPFVQYPFIGGSTGNFGFPGFMPTGSLFGFDFDEIPVITSPMSGGNGADNFPGMGSPYGSILPGIAFQSACSGIVDGNECFRGVFYPTVFTGAPSYLPDAPFVNRTYGESAFSTFTAGGKVRFNDVNDWWGLALVGAYRFYADDASEFSGFNQLQRGASPGGSGGILGGDVLVTGVFDGRIKKWWNISANIGYHWNRDVKADDAFGGDVTLLDRPDELLLSVGTDFPVNRYFQPIAEFRSTHYIGSRTPNAFENDPYEGLIGARIFPARWFGFSLGYRYHFNQQDRDSFDDDDTFTSTAFVPCSFQEVGIEAIECNESGIAMVQTTTAGVPRGFRTSTDPHGFFAQFFIGRRNKRQEDKVNGFADVTGLSVSDDQIKLGCAPGFRPKDGETCNESTSVSVSTTAVDPENDVLTYNYTVSGGRIVGTGANVTWDLSGVQPGTYTVTAGVDDGCGLCGKTQTKTVTVAECDCVKICECPSLSISGPAGITPPGETMTFTVTASGGTQDNLTYNWSVSAGTIESGQGTPSIVVRTTREMANSSVTASVELGGMPEDCHCPNTASETGGIGANPQPVLVDEFGKRSHDEIRAQLDIFFSTLANNPTDQGYIINYGTPKEVAEREKLITNHINFRKFDRSRITLVNGGASSDGVVHTKLYRIPPGAENPAP